MKRYRISYYRANFECFKKTSSGRINNLPASNDDDFSLVACTNLDGRVGFDSVPESIMAINSLVSKCYFIDLDGQLQPPKSSTLNYMPLFLFRDMDGRFEKVIEEHKQYERAYKKYKVLSRYRDVEEPEPSMLSDFSKEKNFRIEESLYRLLKNTCHYVVIAKISGEYGHGAFDVFSGSLDFFYEEFQALAGESCEWTALDSPSEFVHF